MKKGFLSLIVLFAALFIGIVGVKAEIVISGSNCQITNPEPGVANASCDLQLKITDPSVIKNGDEFDIIIYEPSHIKDNSVTINMEDGWEIKDVGTTGTYDITDGKTITVVYKGTAEISASALDIKIAAGTYQKDDAYADNCGFLYGTPAKACEYRNGYYFGIDGRNVDEDTYYKECNSCKVENGKYYGLNGKETDEATYNKECTNICKKEDGKYFCKDGKECTKEDYENECAKNPNQGAFLPIAGIIAGVALIGVSTIMVRKQSKLRKL